MYDDNCVLPNTKDYAIAAIARLKDLARECERVGLTGAALDNERTIELIKQLWNLK